MPSKAFTKIKRGLEEAITYAKGQTAGTRFHSFANGVHVIRLRERLGLSQTEFARGFDVPVKTLQNWEQGRREPRGAARTLLTMIEAEPDVVAHLIWPRAKVSRQAAVAKRRPRKSRAAAPPSRR